MPSPWKQILFDLDGTLTDSQVGIFRCLHYGLSKVGVALEPSTDLRWCVGPPLLNSLTRLAGGDSRLGAQALQFYRERYAEKGMFENRIYDGIPECLQSLQGKFDLYLATSKPWVYAREIVKHFQIDVFFKEIYGSELDGTRVEKTDLIRHILNLEALDPERTIMVGDREQDVTGARNLGVSALGAGWGFGSEKELREAGTRWVVHHPSEILGILTLEDD